MIGTFAAADMFLFYVFWEVMLVPMYFLIGIWGSERRLYSAIKFFLYTLAGSVFMLLAILKLYFIFPELVASAPEAYSVAAKNLAGDNLPMLAMLEQAAKSAPGSFNIWAMQALGMATGNGGALINLNLQIWLFIGFALAFAIKVPLFPFHTWLPDAHTDAPTAGSVILAGVLLKMGTYGFLRFNLPILSDACRDPRVIRSMAVLAIVGIIYGALCALAQKDMKRLIAYSSVSHLGMVVLGIFALNPNGINGAILQQLNHGISTGALFLLVGVIYERRHTRLIAEYGGLAQQMPQFAAVFMIMTLSSIGLPLLNGFIGEFLILRGVLETNFRWAIWGAIGIVLGAAYLLWLYQQVFLGELTNERNRNLPDLNWREWLCFAPLLVLVFGIGIYPRPVLDYIATPTNLIVKQVRGDYFGLPAVTLPAAKIQENHLPASTGALTVPDNPKQSISVNNKILTNPINKLSLRAPSPPNRIAGKE
jgi:NADH-quinone oxidoreductase subunit M